MKPFDVLSERRSPGIMNHLIKKSQKKEAFFWGIRRPSTLVVLSN
jgi:hypothetical protein